MSEACFQALQTRIFSYINGKISRTINHKGPRQEHLSVRLTYNVHSKARGHIIDEKDMMDLYPHKRFLTFLYMELEVMPKEVPVEPDVPCSSNDAWFGIVCLGFLLLKWNKY